jgi:hypothetical protein
VNRPCAIDARELDYGRAFIDPHGMNTQHAATVAERSAARRS